MTWLNFYINFLLVNSYQYIIWSWWSPPNQIGFHLTIFSNNFNVYSLISCIPVKTKDISDFKLPLILKFVSKKNFLFGALDQLQENLPLLPVFGCLPIHSLCTATSLPGSESTNKANVILLINRCRQYIVLLSVYRAVWYSFTWISR